MRNSVYRADCLTGDEDSQMLTRRLLDCKGILNVKTYIFSSKIVVCYDEKEINHIDIRNFILDAGFDI